MKNTKYIFLGAILATGFLVTSVWVRAPRVVQAADNNFTDGITVDSTGDGTDANTADSICDDGSGNCTLRAAIEESNQEAGAQTIKFNITGPEDFNNGGQSGYSIKPTSGLPNITDTVTINGYTQPGSLANTAEAPNPLNGILLIEVDGTSAGSVDGLDMSSNNIEVKGLVINNFAGSGLGIGADDVIISGCYVGTDFTGLIDEGNDFGVSQITDDSDNLHFGGLNPEDRNIVSGNDTTGLSPNTDSDNWIIQGNYFGIGSDGSTIIPNAQVGGSGAISLDDSSGHIVGGNQPGAINVISGNRSHGIAPQNCNNSIVEGNYIGVKADGITPAANGTTGSDPVSAGLVWSSSSNITIVGNIIANNLGEGGGISLMQINGGTIQGNKIYNNNGAGVGVTASSNLLIGGADNNQGNTIDQNTYGGIFISSLFITNYSFLIPSDTVTVIGNTVYDNDNQSMFGLGTSGLGIDLGLADITGLSISDLHDIGSNPNDAGDIDTGSNGYLNFPVINSTTASAGNLDVNFSLDVDNSASGYRVEFFANPTADPSGYGEGQIYLGSVDVSGSVTNATAGLSIPSSFSSGKYAITATTTAKDNSVDGFGDTSEFSAVLGEQTVVAAVNSSAGGSSTNGSLANTGQNSVLITLAADLAIIGGVSTMLVLRRRTNAKR